jgi:beta-glucosidase
VGLRAPYEHRTRFFCFESLFHQGRLEFTAETIDHVAGIARTVLTIVDVFLDRPAVLTGIAEAAAALVA